ncbi:MAG: extracellular solute-binding protein family 1 [Herbinix sp.]|jgi:ABC-type glycerol-3-phosphate transport system substrate-binding protein|nr:extracellular solute-binding protein family 1 [Herbinix sp.]
MKKMKKLVSILLCLVFAVSMLAACGKKGESSDANDVTDAPKATETPADDTDDAEPTEAPTEEPFEISLGIWPEETMAAQIELHNGYVETFKEKHPNVTVVPAYYRYAVDTFVPLAESGNLPVVFDTWYTDTQKLINGGFVADITDNLEKRGWLDKIVPEIRDIMSKDGKTYGLPRDGYALGIMLNVALFKEAGLVDADGYPLYPKTWEELAQTAKTIKEKTGAAGLCLLAADNAGGWHFTNIAWAFGANFVTIGEDGKYTANVDSPEAIAAMEYVKSLKWEYDVLTSDPTVENWGTGFTQLGTGAAAMYIAAADAVDQPTYNNGLPKDDLSIVPLPAGPNGLQFSLSGGTPYMFSKEATEAQIDAALDYIEVMGKGPVISAGAESDAQYRVDSDIPVLPGFKCWNDQAILDADAAVVAKYSNVDMKLYQNYFDTIKLPGNLRLEEQGNTQELYRELTNVLQAVITNKDADVAALMKTADENYQTILDTEINAD